MKYFTLLLMFFSLFIVSCQKDEDEKSDRKDESIAPTTSFGRDNEILDTIEISSKEVEISVWDYASIDGDVISVYVNGEAIITEDTLRGYSERRTVNAYLENDGFNYILMYAHNEGYSPPNTASIKIYDGVNSEQFFISSSLQTNGVVDIIVN